MFFTMINFVAVVFVFCTCQGYSTKCSDDSYFDPKRQKYLPCTECNEINHAFCHDCCSPSHKDTDAVYLSKPQTTELVPSVKNEDTAKQNMVGLFFHIFIIIMVVCTLSVIGCVGIKAAKDRRTNECSMQDSRHSHHHDVAVIEEVWVTAQPQCSMEKPSPTVIAVVNQLQESIPKQGGVDKPML